MYTYNSHVTKVYDGDTITVDIDLGFGVFLRNQKIRLAGIDAPEIRGDEREAGLVSRDWLREQVLDKDVVLKTYKDKKGKYGRWIADVHIDDRFINAELLHFDYAKIYGEPD
jgi:micrococcal nuclease